VIVCDTGPIVAAAIRMMSGTVSALTCSQRCIWLAAAFLSLARSSLRPAIYWPAKAAQAWKHKFLTSLADGTLHPVELTREDYARAAELVLAYQSLPLGTTDATVIAVCERLGLTEVASLDGRHFTVVRPRHVKALTLLPE